MPPLSTNAMATTTSADEFEAKNVTFAVNYEVSMVDHFLPTTKRKRRPSQQQQGSAAATAAAAVPPSLMRSSSADTATIDTRDEAHNKEEAAAGGGGGRSCQQAQQQQQAVDERRQPQVTIQSTPSPVPPSNTMNGVNHGNNTIGGGKETIHHTNTSSTTQQQQEEDERRTSARPRRERPERRGRNTDGAGGPPKSHRARVRYDMQRVPPARRNKAFLDRFPTWWFGGDGGEVDGGGSRSSSSSSSTTKKQHAHPQRATRTNGLRNTAAPSSASSTSSGTGGDGVENHPPGEECFSSSSSSSSIHREDQPQAPVAPLPPSQPFLEDASVIWAPSKRTEWEDTISEMTAVCTSAALRRHVSKQQQAAASVAATAGAAGVAASTSTTQLAATASASAPSANSATFTSTTTTTTAAGAARASSPSTTTTKPFHAPLSRDYIRDRVDIDDPLNGYQLRHKTGGWLQGFVMWTNFTVWSHYFRWDSRHPQSGIPQAAVTAQAAAAAKQQQRKTRGGNASTASGTTTATATSTSPPLHLLDADGSLATALDRQERSGDPLEGGIVFNTIAEIALVGGLGCGEYMVRMALDEIRSKKTYRYVVLQATDSSKTFYERFGFVRVGAVCRYGKGTQVADEHSPLMGYRHWTHANESEKSLEMHGGPSYMMCLQLPENNMETIQQNPPSLLEAMLSLSVEHKPTIEQLGAAATPGPRAFRRGSSFASLGYDSSASASSPTPRRKTVGRPKGSKNKRKSISASSSPLTTSSIKNGTTTTSVLESAFASAAADTASTTEPKSKRRKLENTAAAATAGGRTRVPSPGLGEQGEQQQLSAYALKQYQHPWLAVPPFPTANASRPPPKDRSSPLVRVQGRPPRPPSRPSSTTTTAVKSPVLSTPQTTSSSAKKKKTKSSPSTPQQSSSAKKKKNQSSSHKKKRTGSPSSSSKKKRKSGGGLGSPDRNYHAVRGPNGRFVPMEELAAAASSTATARAKTSIVNSSVSKSSGSKKRKSRGGGGGSAVDRTTLRKQKVTSYPRDKVHFYNRIVKRKRRPANCQYYFVLNYEEKTETLTLVPMTSKAVFTGMREGRPRYTVMIEDTDANFITGASTADYQVVEATMIMKTPIVASEAWDIEDD